MKRNTWNTALFCGHKFTSIVLLCTLMFISCLSHNKDDDIMCTMEYRMLTVTVCDESNVPVVLDSCFVTKTSTGEIIDFSGEDPYFDSISRIQGIYLLFTDGKMDRTTRDGEMFEFHGIRNGAVIATGQYKIGHDLCHVLLRSGLTRIVVQN